MTNSRDTFYPSEEILREVETFIERYGDETFDVVTIVGEGEPTLYTPLDEIAKGVKSLTKKPLVLITNGSLFYDSSVQLEVSKFDIVMPTLDAWDEESFRSINRPFGKLNYEEVFNGIVEFSKKFQGQIWLEVMLIKDRNDSEKALNLLKERIDKIAPDRVYINVPVRPPAEKGVEIPDESKINRAHTLFGTYSIESLPKGNFLSPENDAMQAILEIIKRHPMSEDDLKNFLTPGSGLKQLEKIFSSTSEKYNIEKCFYHGKIFYRYTKKRREKK